MTINEIAEDKKNLKLEIAILCIVIVFMVLSSFKNFILFHSLVELFSIIVAFCITIIAFNTYKINKNQYIALLGIAYGFIATFDLLHTLAYKGIEIFAITGSNLPAQLWISARYMEAISLLAMCIFLRKKINLYLTSSIYVISSLLIILSIFYFKNFPDCFIEGVGLTSFKIYSEYIISAILALAAFLIFKNKDNLEVRLYRYLLISIVATILSEMAFTLYIDVFGFFNMVGHVLKVISFYLIYKAIVEVNFRAPYEALKKREADYRNLVELMPTGVCVYNNSGAIYVNTSFMKLLGASCLEDVTGVNILNFIDVEYHQSLKDYLKLIEAGNYKETIEKEIRKSNGEILVLELRATPCYYLDEESILIMINDISQRRKAEILEVNLEHKQRLLKESEENDLLKTEFFNNLTHELRTPLNLIFSIIQLMDNHLGGSKEARLEKYLRSLRQNCYRMLRLINNLLDITKLDAGYFQIKCDNHNIVAIVEDITLSLAEYAEKSGKTLIFDTDFEEKSIAIDPNAIERIMLNLLSNAMKFTKAGDKIAVTMYDKDDYIAISIKDTGIGIPQNKLKVIFDRFRQVEKSLKNNIQGTGIGLALVESLVKMHGGNIIARSQHGGGSEFIVTLPAKYFESHEASQQLLGSNIKNYVEAINIEFSDIYLLDNIS